MTQSAPAGSDQADAGAGLGGPSWTRRSALGALSMALLESCVGGSPQRSHRWAKMLDHAPYPGAYNFPVHVAGDGRFVALHPKGTWSSRDGRNWEAEPLTAAVTPHSSLPYVQHRGATWILAQVRGNYLDYSVDPVVRRTADYRSWETVGRSNLPRLILPAIASFRNALWVIGGLDGKGYSRAVLRSEDGLSWDTVVRETPWQPGARGQCAVFQDRLWLIGPGGIDETVRSEVWSTPNGSDWRLEAPRLNNDQPFGYTAQAFDNRLWLVGANRAGTFRNSMLVSNNGRNWTAIDAPWSPRGLPATWVAGRRLFLTGGKYSFQSGGEARFVYSNDVWLMSA